MKGELIIFCPQCGNEVKSVHRLCPKCGKSNPNFNRNDISAPQAHTKRYINSHLTSHPQTNLQSPAPEYVAAEVPYQTPTSTNAPQNTFNQHYSPASSPMINQKANKTRKALTLVQSAILLLQVVLFFCKIVKVKVTMFNGAIDSDALAEIAGDYFYGKTSFSLFDMFTELAKLDTIGLAFMFITVILMAVSTLFVLLTLLKPKIKINYCKIPFCNLALISTIFLEFVYGFFTLFVIIAMVDTAASISSLTSYLAGTTVTAYPTFFGILAIITCLTSFVMSIVLRVFASKSTHI